MKLYENQNEFVQLINLTADYLGMDPALVEKDYFVTLFLKRASEKIPGLVFKGGTSLSKCYKIIDRFSEDLDLTLDLEHFSQGKKIGAVKTLIEVSSEFCFNLKNRQEIENHTHGNFNRFDIEYPIVFPSDSITPGLKVEMTYIQKSYPCAVAKASSYIADYLLASGYADIVAEYEMKPFEMQVQSLERTLIDKLFALGDYYLSGSMLRTSRHIYDIHRLLTLVDVSQEEIKTLVKTVRLGRKSNRMCLSAQDDVDMQELLKEIIAGGAFKKDYDEVTMKLLTRPIEYREVIRAIQTIVDSGMFDRQT